MNEPFKIGTYQMGYRWVDIVAIPNDHSGSFVYMPGFGNDHSKIEVGIAGNIDEAFAVLMHEAMELALDDWGCRFRPTGYYVTNASDIYRFYFDHNQFTEISSRLAWFIWQVRKDFEAAWELFHDPKNQHINIR